MPITQTKMAKAKWKRILGGAFAAALTTVAALSANAAVAQDYPDRPVKMMVGFAPGSTTDFIARLLADGLSKRLGGSFVVENRDGAGGMIATEEVARSEADGYTLLVSGTGTITVNPFVYPDIGYDVEADFEPVTKVVQYPFIIVVNPNGPRTKDVKSLDDLVALAKAEPGRITFGSAGVGNLAHLAAEIMNDALDIETLHVPFRGSAPAVEALLAGAIDFMFAPLIVLPQIEAGNLRALAVTDDERWRDLPDTPAAVSDLGIPELNISLWTGVLAPKGTPKEIVDLLNREIAAIGQDPEYGEKLSQQGMVVDQTPEDYAAEIKSEMAANEPVIRRLDIQPQ